MFCFQCEQTAKGEGCTVAGVCGKTHETASMQDLLITGLKDISRYAYRARKLGKKDKEIDLFIIESLFSTVTNVNFDETRFQPLISKAKKLRDRAKELYESASRKQGKEPEHLQPIAEIPEAVTDIKTLVALGEKHTIPVRISKLGKDAAGLQELITYGLKGMAAYTDHAHVLKVEDEKVFEFFLEALDFLSKEAPSADELVTMAMKAGQNNLKVMELLDKANTGAYGQPVPTQVRITPLKGKAILISGHDLKDLDMLLKQTEGKGINIYTHSEMLPTHTYPELKRYKHLAGNYGSAWQNQQTEFSDFPGAIVMTTNCIQRPKNAYKHRIFTTGLVGFPELKHIPAKENGQKDFTPVIESAFREKGFDKDGEEKYITVGFGHNTVLGIAGKVIEAVKTGQIRHFFLIGGCDGAKPGRNYYTEFAEKIPKDCIILTLACGKYRFNKLEFGDIGGIPRLLDMGQCNDAYSAIKVAAELAKAFNTDVNGLPLSLVLSWYEQKAVAILLTLLSLGIKNIRLGPSLPAFVSQNVLNILVEKFNIMPTSTPDNDLKAILGKN